MNNWITISKHDKGQEFYPINLIGNVLGERKSYEQCYNVPNKYWKDKLVLFHFIWKGPYVADCIALWDKIRKNSKQFWVEFDADHHMKHPHTIDFSIKRPLFLEELSRKATGFIWEFSKDFELFIKPTRKIQLRMYQRKWEKEINTDRKIDFLVLIESRHASAFQQIQLAKSLSEKGYNVVSSVQQKQDYTNFKKLGLNIINKNSTFPAENFYKYLQNSKVVINLSNRFTAGRTVYDSLFAGCLSICSKTYGASELLYPDLTINPFFMNPKEVEDLCIETLNRWDTSTIQNYRNNACNTAGLKNTIEELNEIAGKI